ncbi:hypothetical protein EDC04DRAFT_2889513 [Pisolithus marmoratus]|nr:hypothetical protein EDC04DRAFT_2889513 [Pisolithus marmoratus]
METSHVTFPLLGTSDNFHAVVGLSLQRSPDVLSTEPGITADRILRVLSTGLDHRPSTAPIPPELLFGICQALQSNGIADDFLPYIIPQVLSKLRPWRLLDEKIRCTSQGLHALALELANIRRDGALHSASLDGVSELSISSPYQNANGMHVKQTEEENANSLGQTAFIRNEDTARPRLADTSSSHVVSSPSHKGKSRLSVSPRPINPRTHRRNSSSEYRSGCVACRRPRGSPPQLSPVLPYTEQPPISSTPIRTSALSVCPYPDPKKPSRMRSTAIDENTPPLPPGRANINSGVQRPRERSKGSMTPPRPSMASRVLSPSTVAWSKRQLHPGYPRPYEIGSHKNEVAGPKRRMSHKRISDLLAFLPSLSLRLVDGMRGFHERREVVSSTFPTASAKGQSLQPCRGRQSLRRDFHLRQFLSPALGAQKSTMPDFAIRLPHDTES